MKFKFSAIVMDFVYLELDLNYVWVMNLAPNFDAGNVQFLML